jgi:Transglutaminase-like superfamily
MSFLPLNAYLKLIFFDFYIERRNFEGLYRKVRSFPVRGARPSHEAVERICKAIDVASIWYWKEVLCLQRSAATVCLLKAHGVPAQMVIGIQQRPFKAHAWVEVDGHTVNDRSYTREIYAVLDRC